MRFWPKSDTLGPHVETEGRIYNLPMSRLHNRVVQVIHLDRYNTKHRIGSPCYYIEKNGDVLVDKTPNKSSTMASSAVFVYIFVDKLII